MFKSMTFLSAALALVSLPAGAQTAAAPTTAPQSPPAAPTPSAVTDSELASFAKGTLELHALTDRTPEAMAATISKTGMTVERYNEISGLMRTDTAFQARANAAIQAAMRANAQASTATPAASS